MAYIKRIHRPLTACAVLLALLLSPLAARAETYRMDLIVFLDKTDPSEQGREVALTDTAKSLELGNTAALKAAGIEILPDDQFALSEQWQRLKNARRYQPLLRLAWLQKDPTDRSPALHLRWGESFSTSNGDGRGVSLMTPMDGSVALQIIGNYLNLDADLNYTQRTDTAGGTSNYRLRERRRMKRDELHHLDSAKLGILARVSKATAP